METNTTATPVKEAHVPYQSVNGKWPELVPVPSPQEAMAGAKRLYRFAMKRPFRGKVKPTSGRRYTDIRRGVMYVNAAGHHFGGWKDIVHDLSHYAHARLFPRHKPHHSTHAWLERTMVEHVVGSGWLDGRLKREPRPAKPVDLKAERHARVLARIKAWETKAKRAETALKKLRRQARYYGRQIAA